MKKIFLSLLLVGSIYANEWEIIFNGNCISCHTNNGDKSSAPPTIALQTYYKSIYPNKTEFVQKMAEWLVEPKEETALLKSAIKSYGLMPNVGLDMDSAKGLATYIYEGEFFKPDWFDAHYKNNAPLQ